MPLVHKVFSVEEENEYYRAHPGVHLVKAIVHGDRVHVWIADNKRFNGGHMQPGGCSNE